MPLAQDTELGSLALTLTGTLACSEVNAAEGCLSSFLCPQPARAIFPPHVSQFICLSPMLPGTPHPLCVCVSLSGLACTAVSTWLRDLSGSRGLWMLSLVGDLVHAPEEIAQWLLSQLASRDSGFQTKPVISGPCSLELSGAQLTSCF